MTSAAPSKRQLKTNSLRGVKGVAGWYLPIFRSSVGGKFVVALTGIGLVGFVLVHMIGNLQIFAGQNKINTYAQFLKDLGPLLWVARGGLLAIFILHILFAIRLKQAAAAARPVPYVHEETVQASIASRYMFTTGLIVLAFVLLHLAHFTFGWVHGAEVNGRSVNVLDLRDSLGRHDVYSMMIAGFRNPVIAILYVVAQLVLLLHLSHGIASVFQTLGANSPRWQPSIRMVGWGITGLVTLGNIAIVLGVWTGMVDFVR